MDLQALGVDLGVHLRNCRYWTLLVLIENLPGHSRFNEAILSDPEQIELLLERERNRDPKEVADTKVEGPRLSSFPPEVEAITDLRDSVELLIGVTAAAGGGEYEPRFSRRPEFGYEEELRRIREMQRERAAAPLIGALTPNYQ